MPDSKQSREADGTERPGLAAGPMTAVQHGGAASGVTAQSAAARAAVAVRQLGHELVGHDPDPALLDRVAAAADDLVAAVAVTPLRMRRVEEVLERHAQPVEPDGAALDHGTVCPVSGADNPLGLAMTAWRAGEEVWATVTLGHAAAGSPDIAHGGVIAALFDDLMGFVMDSLAKTAGFTATLTVSYRKPVPIGVPLELRGRLRSREGRKLFTEATILLDGTVFADAEALFIAVAPSVADERSRGEGAPRH
jgi:acyl-coenzyme A thioesterase PaaI-like protein